MSEPAADKPLWRRFKAGLSKTRRRFAEGLGDLLLGERQIDEGVLEELETALLSTDVGLDATERIIQTLAAQMRRRQLSDAEALRNALAALLKEQIADLQAPFRIGEGRPFVVFVVGVNGAGKTTTLGKLANRLQGQGRRVLLAAGDTFRAAAVEQLGVWAERVGGDFLRGQTGADPSAVAYDAVRASVSRGIDLLIIDTAGRVHTKTGLMDELGKLRRVVARELEGAPHETLLVLDATTGQNAVEQARTFDETVGVTGIVLTKLDGTAKGGIIVAIAEQLGIPVKYVGVGEGLGDLREFDAEEFTEALFAPEKETVR